MRMILVDRDGVINKDPGGWTKYSYVMDWEDFHFLPGALEALRLLKVNGIKVVVISNQAGVNKGYFSRQALDQIDRKMSEEIRKSGGKIEESFYCVHRDEDNCNCRKPKTGLIEAAVKKYGIDLNDTYFIGDGKMDVMTGKRMGIKTIFVLSGKTSRNAMRESGLRPNYVFKDFLEAVKWIIDKRKRKTDRALKRQKDKETGS